LRHETEYWQRVGEEWLARAPQGTWRQANDAMITAALARWLPGESGRLLKTDLFEEAAGAGLAAFLAGRARVVAGIDLSFAVARRAHSTRRLTLVAQGDVRSLPFPNGCFDTVVSTSTLDHFATRGEIADALTELARVMAGGGTLLITLDNLVNPLIAVRNAIPHRWRLRLGLTPYYVGATVGPRGLRKLLVAAGFEVETLTAVVHCPRFLGVALAWLADRRGDRAIRAFLRWAGALEWLSRTPSRFLTGHFLAALARRRSTDAARRDGGAGR